MKLALLISFLALTAGSIDGGYHPIHLDGGIISVYYDSLAVYEICKLDNTRSHEDLDWFYYTTVDGQSSSMFHISIYFMAESTFESCEIKGWVHKKDCSVSMQADRTDDNKNHWKFLYKEPNINSQREELNLSRDSTLRRGDSIVQVEEVDLSPGSTMWLKISFLYEGVRHCGWTKKYFIEW